MENRFNYLKREEEIYKDWEEKGYFKPNINKDKKPFCISMPPPNVTAKLHIGHALNNTIQDVFVRYHRLKGDPTLWIPGTDHASIATEVKVVEKLKKEGKTKDELGREKFLDEAWAWKKKYGGEITNQVRKLGCSCDWSKEHFTMDEECSQAVLDVFVDLYNKKLIYKGERIVNWCPKCKTSISETEVEFEEVEGFFWYIKYPIEGLNEYLTIATTRPETLLGDVAVAVNPSDERYKHLVGKKVLLPLVNKYIPIISDYYVDKDFGSGVVKITPGHDQNDFEVGKRHNLDIINIMNEDATLNENGLDYTGLDRYIAREKIIEDLKSQGYILKIENYTHNVGQCYRCHTTIEPYISNQWFVKMETLVKPALDAVKDDKIKFIPKRFEKTYFNWMENIQDWCISRQLWWGHRIPAYYCDKCGEMIVSKDTIDICECGGKLRQDEDTLDTWFSSALWPFSVLGWPKATPEYEYFYPNSLLVTAYDIITFWVSKMIFSGIAYTSKIPFENVYIHGLVRDSEGRKMSKSLGNGVDPLEVAKEYGTDAMRFSLIQNISPGNDIRYMSNKVEAARNFSNKLWNAGKFVNMYVNNLTVDNVDNFMPQDKWVLTKLSQTINEATQNIDKFEIGIACQKIYDFIWFDFCDWYIEMVKPRLYSKESDTYTSAVWTLNYTLSESLKLLHPYMPYITEEIYQNLKVDSKSIMLSNWPKAKYEFKQETKVIQVIMDLIKQIRNERANIDLIGSKKISVQVHIENEYYKKIFKESSDFIKKLGNIENIEYINDITNKSTQNIAINAENITMYLDFSSIFNKELQLNKLKIEKEKLESELSRALSMLSNEKFIAKAPQKLIDEEQEKELKFKDLIEKVNEQINTLK